ncbi:MAG: hypothetical protein AAF456_23170 [Planctomycetota bacterium]
MEPRKKDDFAANFTGQVTRVRNGSLSFGANSFPGGSTLNDFGAEIQFSRGYWYSRGDLTIELRFSRQTGSTVQPQFDALNWRDGPGNGWGVDFAGRWQRGDDPEILNANFIVTKLTSTPEPSSLCFIGTMFAYQVAARNRRRK